MTWGCSIVAAGVMVAGLIEGSTVLALIAVAVALLFAGFSAAGYLLYLRPSLSINDAGLFIRNPCASTACRGLRSSASSLAQAGW
jgi:hypothetical protein